MASVDNSAWNANKAWAAGAASDNPATFYNGICAGKKAGDPSTQGAHALPHHYHPGDAPNAAGVRNALARFSATGGLTNKAAAKSHLDGHMAVIEKSQKSGNPPSARALRALHSEETPGGNIRRANFPAELRSAMMTEGGKQYLMVDGYATVFNRGYTMWDMFGTYQEVADEHMLDRSLAMSPDVAFLMNHTGMTMARTKNGSLTVAKDTHGLAITAKLNMERQDVRDLASAMGDGLVDEMSFAFMIDDGEWSEDFDTFTLKQVDINRGDVSAVNYGANPYTNIGARANDFLREIDNMPPAVKREAVKLITVSDDSGSYLRSALLAVRKQQDSTLMEAARSMGMDFSGFTVEDDTEDDEYSKGNANLADSGTKTPNDVSKDDDDPLDSSDGPDTQSIPNAPEPGLEPDGARSNDNSASKARMQAMIMDDDTDLPAGQPDGDGRSGDAGSTTASKRTVDLYANRWSMFTDDEDNAVI
jgi:HK97 family phage prohead protease